MGLVTIHTVYVEASEFKTRFPNEESMRRFAGIPKKKNWTVNHTWARRTDNDNPHQKPVLFAVIEIKIPA